MTTKDLISRDQLTTAIDKVMDDVAHGENLSNEGFVRSTFSDDVKLHPEELLKRLKYYLTKEGEKRRYY